VPEDVCSALLPVARHGAKTPFSPLFCAHSAAAVVASPSRSLCSLTRKMAASSSPPSAFNARRHPLQDVPLMAATFQPPRRRVASWPGCSRPPARRSAAWSMPSGPRAWCTSWPCAPSCGRAAALSRNCLGAAVHPAGCLLRWAGSGRLRRRFRCHCRLAPRFRLASRVVCAAASGPSACCVCWSCAVGPAPAQRNCTVSKLWRAVTGAASLPARWLACRLSLRVLTRVGRCCASPLA
jgi:hypothetical protein